MAIDIARTVSPNIAGRERTPFALGRWLRTGGTITALAGATVLCSMAAGSEHLATFGYAGIFLISFLASACIVLPAPGLVPVAAMGAVLSPAGVGLAAGLGAALGELSGYYAGRAGRGIIEGSALYDRIDRAVRRAGGPAVAVMA